MTTPIIPEQMDISIVWWLTFMTVIVMAIVTGITLYYFDRLYFCESNPSSGCPRFTCQQKTTSCGNNPFTIDGQGNKVCKDSSQHFNAHS